MGTGHCIAATREIGRQGEARRKSLYARVHMHEHNDDTHSRNTHTDVEREHLLVIIFPVGRLGAFLQ